ncbi:MAG: cobalt-precorrin-6A reductase [Parvibaculaceae bacterium]
MLILGGTAQARQLAELLDAAGYSPVTSLAGITREPRAVSGATRSGGFGGAEGLARYLAKERFACLVDATHPFAVVISQHAKAAAQSCNLPVVRLERPAWRAEPGDRWTDIEDVEAAAAMIPSGARILLTIGRKGIMPFLTRPDISGIARMIEPPQDRATPDQIRGRLSMGSAVDIEVTANWRILLARPPFHVEKELCLIGDNAITHLVTKNSGGEDTRAKLIAARTKGIPVIMIRRPIKPEVPTASDPQAVLALLAQVVSA